MRKIVFGSELLLFTIEIYVKDLSKQLRAKLKIHCNFHAISNGPSFPQILPKSIVCFFIKNVTNCLVFVPEEYSPN